MNCNTFRTGLISDDLSPELEQHMKACPSCSKLYHQIDETMSILDLEVTVPENLAASVMAKKDKIEYPKTRKIQLITYLQVAAAIFLGIFIGHQFGKHASSFPNSKEADPLSQYFQAHHFNISNNESSIFTR